MKCCRKPFLRSYSYKKWSRGGNKLQKHKKFVFFYGLSLFYWPTLAMNMAQMWQNWLDMACSCVTCYIKPTLTISNYNGARSGVGKWRRHTKWVHFYSLCRLWLAILAVNMAEMSQNWLDVAGECVSCEIRPVSRSLDHNIPSRRADLRPLWTYICHIEKNTKIRLKWQ